MYEVTTKFALGALHVLIDSACFLFGDVEFAEKAVPQGRLRYQCNPQHLEAVKVVPELHKLWLGFWGPGWWHDTVLHCSLTR